MVLTIAAFILTLSIILIITIDGTHTQEKPPYVPKRLRPPKVLWIKSMIKMIQARSAPLFNTITNLKGHRHIRHRTQGTWRAGPRCHWYKKVPRDPSPRKSIPVMTTTWTNGTTDIPPGRQFDSDSQALMLDDGASACRTNDKRDFIEPPTRVNRKVRGIKGHAKATYRGTIKWHIEDGTGLVHIMIVKGAYLIPEAATRILSPQHLAQ